MIIFRVIIPFLCISLALPSSISAAITSLACLGLDVKRMMLRLRRLITRILLLIAINLGISACVIALLSRRSCRHLILFIESVINSYPFLN
jgi:hypothetical protein